MAKHAAGVVPFALHPDTGAVWLLIGREAFGRDRGTWSAFAGGKPHRHRSTFRSDAHAERHDVFHAAREAFEESAGVLGGLDALQAHITASGRRVHAGCAIFVVPIHWQPGLPAVFLGVRQAVAASVADATGERYSPFLEKDALEWVPLEAIPPHLPLRRSFAEDLPRVRDAVYKPA
jgi:hypothetical protein